MQQQDTSVLLLFFVWIFVFFWIYTLLWVAKDISWRTNHLWTQVLCLFTIVFLTPVLWLPVYFFLRPLPRKDFLQQQEAFSELCYAQTIHCHICGGANMHDHLYCVFCGEKLKQQCEQCKKWYVLWYLYCPYCATPAVQEDDHTFVSSNV